jgi:hypothetical protein
VNAAGGMQQQRKQLCARLLPAAEWVPRTYHALKVRPENCKSWFYMSTKLNRPAGAYIDAATLRNDVCICRQREGAAAPDMCTSPAPHWQGCIQPNTHATPLKPSTALRRILVDNHARTLQLQQLAGCFLRAAAALQVLCLVQGLMRSSTMPCHHDNPSLSPISGSLPTHAHSPLQRATVVHRTPVSDTAVSDTAKAWRA